MCALRSSGSLAFEADDKTSWTLLVRPASEPGLARIESLLEDAGIPYFVHNRHFGSLLPGPVIPLLNQMTVMVPKEHLDTAQAELSTLPETDDDDLERRRQDRWRPIVEWLVFGWFVPGRRRKDR